jgi:hypothetical protein
MSIICRFDLSDIPEFLHVPFILFMFLLYLHLNVAMHLLDLQALLFFLQFYSVYILDFQISCLFELSSIHFLNFNLIFSQFLYIYWFLLSHPTLSSLFCSAVYLHCLVIDSDIYS